MTVATLMGKEQELREAAIDAIERQYNGTSRPEYGDMINAVVEAFDTAARRSSDEQAEVVGWPGRKFCETAERNATELAKWIKGKDDKQVASDAALAIRTLLASLPASPVAMGGVTGTSSVDVLRELAREERALGYVDHAKWLRYAANRLSSFDALRITAALAVRDEGMGE